MPPRISYFSKFVCVHIFVFTPKGTGWRGCNFHYPMEGIAFSDLCGQYLSYAFKLKGLPFLLQPFDTEFRDFFFFSQTLFMVKRDE